MPAEKRKHTVELAEEEEVVEAGPSKKGNNWAVDKKLAYVS